MIGNMLSGAPSPATGPVASLQGTLGASPQTPAQAAPNMLAKAGQAPGAAPQAPAQPPPSKEQLLDVAHRTAYVNDALGKLIGKPNLSSRNVVDQVGNLVAEQIMDPFMAAKYLGDLPDNTPQIRQWVAQHYANSKQTLQTVTEMIHAEGAMRRRQTAPPAVPQQAAAPQNAFTPQQAQPPSAPPQNMLSGQ